MTVLCDLCKTRDADLAVEYTATALSALGVRLLEQAGTTTAKTVLCLGCAKLCGDFCNDLEEESGDELAGLARERFQ